MSSPADLRYSESHEWFRLDGDLVTMGITQFAADQLTDVTYAEMRPAGTAVEASATTHRPRPRRSAARCCRAPGE